VRIGYFLHLHLSFFTIHSGHVKTTGSLPYLKTVSKRSYICFPTTTFPAASAAGTGFWVVSPVYATLSFVSELVITRHRRHLRFVVTSCTAVKRFTLPFGRQAVDPVDSLICKPYAKTDFSSTLFKKYFNFR